jgi:hypothetical protein
MIDIGTMRFGIEFNFKEGFGLTGYKQEDFDVNRLFIMKFGIELKLKVGFKMTGYKQEDSDGNGLFTMRFHK